MEFLLEYNYDAAEKIAQNGYIRFLGQEFGIGCGVLQDISKELLELDYRLDQNICY
jgi:hypothetical protein